MRTIFGAIRPLLLVSIFLLAFGASAAIDLPYEPDDSKELPGYLNEGTWVEQGPGCEIRLRLLTEEQRLAFLEETTGYRIDPYATPPDVAPRFISFLLEIENRGEGQIYFQSQSAWLRAGSQIQSPLGIDGLSSSFEIIEMEMGAAYERARPAIMEGSSTIVAGETKRGILIYRKVKDRTKKFFLELQLTMPTGELMRVTAPYRLIKKSKKEKKEKKEKKK
jgi:hypothetical protein